MRSKGVMIAGLPQHVGHLLPNGERSSWVQDVMTGTWIRLDRAAACAAAGPRGRGQGTLSTSDVTLILQSDPGRMEWRARYKLRRFHAAWKGSTAMSLRTLDLRGPRSANCRPATPRALSLSARERPQ
jgi:hypothetical protein